MSEQLSDTWDWMEGTGPIWRSKSMSHPHGSGRWVCANSEEVTQGQGVMGKERVVQGQIPAGHQHRGRELVLRYHDMGTV